MAATAAVIAKKTTLNFLIMGVIPEEMVFPDLGYNGNSVNNDNLNKTGIVDNYISIPLALIVVSNEANLENSFWNLCFYYLFRRSCLNIIPEWGWKGTRPMRLGRWGRSRHWCSLISSGLEAMHGLWLH